MVLYLELYFNLHNMLTNNVVIEILFYYMYKSLATVLDYISNKYAALFVSTTHIRTTEACNQPINKLPLETYFDRHQNPNH